MSWTPVGGGGGGGYDYIQDTAPSDPTVGALWLDTSQDPPISKVYADLGGGGQWTTDYLDAPVSEAGGVDWASKTPKSDNIASDLTVNGSGYLLSVESYSADGYTGAVTVTIDGSSIGDVVEHGGDDGGATESQSMIYRFDSSLTVSPDRDMVVTYVLD